MGIRDPYNLHDTLDSAMRTVLSDQPSPLPKGIMHHAEGVDLLPSNIELSGMEVTLVSVGIGMGF